MTDSTAPAALIRRADLSEGRLKRRYAAEKRFRLYRLVAIFAALGILGLLIGTLTWDIIERLFALGGFSFSLSTAPLGFDLGVIRFYLRFNPGSFLGCGGGILLFRSL